MNLITLLKVTTSLIFYVLGLVVFIAGFIPSKVNKLHSFNESSLHSICLSISSNEEICPIIYTSSTVTKHFDKLVLIVIDALRADFIPSVLNNTEFKTNMPFTESLIKSNKALAFISQVHSPTVTMPRIKTIVTGGISNFMDVIMNLNAIELNEDNIIQLAIENNNKIVFYGDDTWTKLFPKHFTRSEGTHSFFVSDFIEVDDNVTRHLPYELSKNDWDIMILHYLGVDHIGHSLGPSSPHLKTKLLEMDDIIEKIYSNLARLDSLLIVTGDHGMTSGGSHGGITPSEVLTPLIFIKTSNTDYVSSTMQTVSQVDFAVTISILMGLPIPANSFGCLIPSVLHFSGLAPKQILRAATYNLLQLLHVHKAMHLHTEYELMNSIQVTLQEHFNVIHKLPSNGDLSLSEFSRLLQLYMNLLNKLKQNLLASVSGYSTTSITTGLVLMWLPLPSLISCLLDFQKRATSKLFGYAWKMNLTALPLLLFGYKFFPNYLWLLIIPLGIMIIFSILVTAISILKNIYLSKIEIVCILTYSLHAMSMFSSSFIEEEHQVWYFSVSTVFIVFLLENIKSICDSKKKAPTSYISKKVFGKLDLDQYVSKIYQLFFLLIIHRITRSWNQTGIKWQHLVDISDVLNKENNFNYKLMLVIFSQIMIAFFLKERIRLLSFYLMGLGSFFIILYKYKSVTTSLFFKGVNIDPIIFSWITYIVILIIIGSAFHPNFSKRIHKYFMLELICAFVLLSQLIGRIHNVPLIAALLMQEHLVHKMMQTCDSKLVSLCIYLQLAMCSFFYQGNSNSLSTIDINSGYIGLLSYKPVISGILITINTYSSVILWLMLLIHRISSSTITSHSTQRDVLLIFGGIVIYKMFILAMYCIVMNLMKHHLFVLSVFAPKLFYEICHLIFFLIFIICISLASIFVKDELENVNKKT